VQKKKNKLICTELQYVSAV